ncbi:tetratricopeptide repeat protein [Oleidesulfovibrio sp.]|uniref:tetratricopeptide repeat protein n=1 Tax=Oleidesulfovibrio sp. TaxID=2909707 RepID=UPI003A87FD2E
MNEKIKWYREVLELEPSSKVFFPLARLFSDNGQFAEAVETLRQGLDRHPEHLEARMLLIECLDSLGRELEADDEAEALSERLRKYPQFWQAWGRSMASRPDSRDASLALDFLAASFGDSPVSWAAVIEQGLRSLSADGCNASAESKTGGFASPAMSVSAQDIESVAAAAVTTEAQAGISSDEASDFIFEEPESSAAEQVADVSGFSVSENAAEQGNDDFDVEDDEPLSLRTRSMADVLAQQGDIKGAMEILDELLAGTMDSEVRRDILARKESLTLIGSASTSSKDAQAEQPLHSKHKLLTMLESLAERLEARAAG